VNSFDIESSPVSAYIPCYNNGRTIGLALQGIQNQSRPVDEIFVVDDGSTDDSANRVEGLGVRVIRMGQNRGRGAVRARAMEAARHEFVLCCDATNRLATNFLEIALRWFSAEAVSAVFGRFHDPDPRGAVDRWRARHLFQQDHPQQIKRPSNLSTYGAMVRKSAVLRAGNYNPLLPHGEDFELGTRLLEKGEVIFDPALQVEPVIQNTLFQVMERYSRWYRASIPRYTINSFIDSQIVAWRILIPTDLGKRDWPAAFISATLPYFTLAYADNRAFSFSMRDVLKKIAPRHAGK
jgi:glycosyltransferase involved in cell wall biosynthesis